jgi:hypothetical protein
LAKKEELNPWRDLRLSVKKEIAPKDAENAKKKNTKTHGELCVNN